MKFLQKHKSKIAIKLSLYFTISLFVFSLIIGLIFMWLFRTYTINMHKKDMEQRALTVAENASSILESQGGMMSGQGGFFRFLGEIAGSDVWLIDDEFRLITSPMMHQGMGKNHYQYTDLPENADTLVKDVFQDKIVFGRDFSSLLSEVTLTVGVPIKSINDSRVIGVVLIHSAVDGVERAVYSGFTLMGISIVIALLISLLLSVGFSIRFTKPLNIMKDTALLLAAGDYSAKTNVSQKDEIGELASEIDALSIKLHQASRQSESLEKMRKDFIANISHELKTPVTVIRGSLEALLDRVVIQPEQVEDYYRQMLGESLFLQRLIGDLLELSKLQNPDFVIEKQEWVLNDILDDALRSAGQLAAKRDIKIEVDKTDFHLMIYGDYGRLKQMFMTVLDNGIKFSENEGRIEVTCANNCVSIRDFGLGISKEDLPNLFERFYKSRSEQNKTGTGLGLAIAKQIADRHGIGIIVDSEEGKGTIFIFKILQK